MTFFTADNVWYRSRQPEQYSQRLLDTVEQYPFLLDVLAGLEAEDEPDWNGLPEGQMDAHALACDQIEISPVLKEVDNITAITFEDALTEPENVSYYSLYGLLGQSQEDEKFWGIIHDSQSLAECEMRALLYLHMISKALQPPAA
ncbi:hypothetical protein [Nissabacter archeti]|uniref:hypothetical protein n=1 Tax=Nissabacter archeti TaxID=1917880 RepID=UPI0009335F48|nr:hypothetical protein [Nissabacter archeti]